MTTASPTKLLAARYVIAATAIVSATALTVGLAAPAVAATNVAHPTGAVAADNAPRQVTTDVALAALIDNFIGIYGVGPVFQALRMAGVNDPANLLKQAVGLIGNEQLSDAVGALTDVLGALADEIPIDAAVPGFGPAGVYDRVNALSYSGGLTSGMIMDEVSHWGTKTLVDTVYEFARECAPLILTSSNPRTFPPILRNKAAALVALEHGTDTAWDLVGRRCGIPASDYGYLLSVDGIISAGQLRVDN